MRATFFVILTAVCVIAEKKADRRTKPFVADAAGNTLPPPSVLPATVGSPVNLLTPDRYEFYTFDESGELVKRLMTLEEIQAIVAAGEDSDGLVTFANDNQPTIAFNFSQPPFTKVHNVVTNVQNVLKAQMEAHKKLPQMRPTLDTPDVSDSWSLILPSIFGNTGVDITPDKATAGYTPETDTMVQNLNRDDEENLLSKEGESQISSSTIADDEKINIPLSTTTVKPTTTSTTTAATTTTSTTQQPSTTEKVRTTPKVVATTRLATKSTTSKPTTTRPTTTKVTTIRPTTAKLSTTTTTAKSITTKATTAKPVRTVRTTPKPTTAKPTTIRPLTSTSTKVASSTEKISEQDKISTYIPISTVKYITERTTKKPYFSKKPTTVASTTKRSPSTPEPQATSTVEPKITVVKSTTEMTSKDPEAERLNATTVTTQSVSPSTAITSTEFITSGHARPEMHVNNGVKDNAIIPMFDVAQSISQIASDLGNNYQPIPTASNLFDTTQANPDDMESKENLDVDIPATGTDNRSNDTSKSEDNFIKISTIDPHAQQKREEDKLQTTEIPEVKTTTEVTTESVVYSTTVSANSDVSITTIDPILSESMDDLLSQVVNEAPQSIIDSNEKFEADKEITTTEKIIETTTDNIETTSITSTTSSSTTVENINSSTNKEFSSTTDRNKQIENAILENNINEKINQVNIIENNKVDKKENESKGQTNKDFVQISISNENSTQEPVTDTVSVKQDNDNSISNETQQITTTEVNNKNVIDQSTKTPETSTSQTSEIEPTTSRPNTPTNVNEKISQSYINKINSVDKNTNKHDKLESIPKIDEFKKKIQKVNIADEELVNERNNSWKLIPTVTPPKVNDKDKNKSENPFTNDQMDDKDVILEYSKENQGLEVTTKDLGGDIAQFTELCNELAFRYWHTMVENIDKRRSFVLSPYSITSMLAMMFMGARGATSGEMNDILKLDDMVTFNPHFTLKNISDSIETTPETGVIVSAFIRELYSDRNKGKILTFYKERAQHFYNGHVEEINFKLISDIIRRRTNLLVKRYTWGKIPEYMKSNNIAMNPPLAAFSANIYHTDCTGTSVDGRDGEMYFVVSPNIRQRRLVPVPAVVYKSGFLAGYDPVLDATVAALGNTNSIVSTIFLMPGQQGNIVHSDDLEKLEQRLLEAHPTKPVWNRVLRTLLPRVGLELQIPRFSHKSVFNVSSTLQEMGLKDLFDANHADLGGLNGPSKDLYLSDMVQVTSFVTCGEGMVGEQHHVEEYPESSGLARRRTSRWINNDWNEPRDYQRAFHDPHDVGEAMHLPLHLRPRQARVPTRSVQSARLKFDRPFLFFVRHNYSGMILYVGRYNPRLLP